MATAMEHFFQPSKYYLTFGPNEPAYHVKPGDTLVAPTVDARGYDARGIQIPEDARQRSPLTTFCPSNPLVGPFYVEGAEPGDALVVKIERIVLNRPMAWSRIRANFGSFTEEVPGKRFLLNEPLEERLFEWTLDLRRNLGILNLPKSRLGRVEIPLHPFLGSIGVAPRFGRVETALTPGEYGGNMDCIETREGATLYFPVFVKGAYLAFGDVHAAQGDGEICGVALETTAEVRLHIDLMKGKEIEWPRIEDEDWIMVAGSSKPLMEAFKIAHYELLNWLVKDYGFDRWEGFQLLSQVGRCRIGNVVDPFYTVLAKFPKRFLP
ncbi:MAG: acetamidase/formamidase family protein [Candidatus Bathyarchaeia archaeon]